MASTCCPSTPSRAVATATQLLAESSAGIDALVVDAGAVEKHVANIVAKLDLPIPESDDHRVLAVLRHPEPFGASG